MSFWNVILKSMVFSAIFVIVLVMVVAALIGLMAGAITVSELAMNSIGVTGGAAVIPAAILFSIIAIGSTLSFVILTEKYDLESLAFRYLNPES